MSDIRDKAQAIIDEALPNENSVITSDGATGSKYAAMTGLSQATVT